MKRLKLNTVNYENRKPSMSIMSHRFFCKASELVSKTKLTCIEIEGLLRILDKLVQRYNSPMTRTVFKDVMYNFFAMTNDMMLENIFRVISSSENLISYDDWIRLMDIFLRGDLIQKAEFVFSVYDHQKRDFLTKEDVQHYLKDVSCLQLPEEDIEELNTDMLDMTLSLLDRDKDGCISRKDFIRSVINEPLLLQVLGECVPSVKYVRALDIVISQGNDDFRI